MKSVHDQTASSKPVPIDVPPSQGDPPHDDPAEGWSYREAPELSRLVGANLRRLRVKRGLSLERLSKLCKVSRAMLGQIELGQSAPTINVLWKISTTLGVPFSALTKVRPSAGTHVLRLAQAKHLTNHDGTFSSRALFPFDEPRRVEFYELKLAAGAFEAAEAHSGGTVENLVVLKGRLQLEVAGEKHVLEVGDAILFEADEPHVYRNVGSEEVVMHLVMTYAETIG